MQAQNIDTGVSLYDINKQIYNKMKPLDPIFLHSQLADVTNSFAFANYVMLLCKERSDYTIFHLDQTQKIINMNFFIKELKETLNNRGQVVSVEQNNNGFWEFWIKDPVEEDVFMYALFDANNFIVEIK